MAVSMLALMAFLAGLAIGTVRRERRNQQEWRDYQRFLDQQRERWRARCGRTRPGDDVVV